MTKCKGVTIPQYKQVKELRANPLYLGFKLPAVGRYGHLNTTEEFIETIANVEIGSICADCKRVTCKDDYDPRKEETYLPTT